MVLAQSYRSTDDVRSLSIEEWKYRRCLFRTLVSHLSTSTVLRPVAADRPRYPAVLDGPCRIYVDPSRVRSCKYMWETSLLRYILFSYKQGAPFQTFEYPFCPGDTESRL